MEEELPQFEEPSEYLFYAVERQRLSFINEIIKSGEVDVSTVNGDGETALHVASSTGAIDAVRALLRAGCKVDVRASQGRCQGCTAYEAASNNREVKQAFEAEMLQAVGLGDIDRVKGLLDGGLEVDTVDTATGNSFLHWACIFDKADVTRLLLERGADRDLRNKANKTAAENASSQEVSDAFTSPSVGPAEVPDKPPPDEPAIGAGRSSVTVHRLGTDGGEGQGEEDLDDVAQLRRRLHRTQVVAEERLHTIETLRSSLSVVLEDRGVMLLVQKLMSENKTLEADLKHAQESASMLQARLQQVFEQQQEQQQQQQSDTMEDNDGVVPESVAGDEHCGSRNGAPPMPRRTHSPLHRSSATRPRRRPGARPRSQPCSCGVVVEQHRPDTSLDAAHSPASPPAGLRNASLEKHAEHLQARVQLLEGQLAKSRRAVVAPVGFELVRTVDPYQSERSGHSGIGQGSPNGLLGSLVDALYRRIVGVADGGPGGLSPA